MGNNCSVWFNAVVRGDVHSITIGENTNIQDGAVIHCTYKKAKVTIGNNVSIAHNAVVHGCTIEDRCLIGMNAVVLSGAHVKSGCIVGAGAVVKENMVAGPFQLLAGIPAVVKKQFIADDLKILDLVATEYLVLAKDHRKAVSRL